MHKSQKNHVRLLLGCVFFTQSVAFSKPPLAVENNYCSMLRQRTQEDFNKIQRNVVVARTVSWAGLSLLEDLSLRFELCPGQRKATLALYCPLAKGLILSNWPLLDSQYTLPEHNKETVSLRAELGDKLMASCQRILLPVATALRPWLASPSPFLANHRHPLAFNISPATPTLPARN